MAAVAEAAEALARADAARLADPEREATRLAHAAAFDALAAPVEDAFAEAIRRVLTRALAAVGIDVNAVVAAAAPLDPNALGAITAGWADEVNGLADRLAEVHGAAGIAVKVTLPTASRLADADPGLDPWNVVHANGRTHAATASNRLVGIGDKAWADARAVIAQAIDEGWDTEQVTKALQDRLAVAESRARTIARTETTAALNAGTVDGVKALGKYAPRQKEWMAATDSRTRDTHYRADGQVRPVDSPFDVGGVKVRYPGDPFAPARETVNCRCTVLFVEAGDEPNPADDVTDSTSVDPVSGVEAAPPPIDPGTPDALTPEQEFRRDVETIRADLARDLARLEHRVSATADTDDARLPAALQRSVPDKVRVRGPEVTKANKEAVRREVAALNDRYAVQVRSIDMTDRWNRGYDPETGRLYVPTDLIDAHGPTEAARRAYVHAVNDDLRLGAVEVDDAAAFGRVQRLAYERPEGAGPSDYAYRQRDAWPDGTFPGDDFGIQEWYEALFSDYLRNGPDAHRNSVFMGETFDAVRLRRVAPEVPDFDEASFVMPDRGVGFDRLGRVDERHLTTVDPDAGPGVLRYRPVDELASAEEHLSRLGERADAEVRRRLDAAGVVRRTPDPAELERRSARMQAASTPKHRREQHFIDEVKHKFPSLDDRQARNVAATRWKLDPEWQALDADSRAAARAYLAESEVGADYRDAYAAELARVLDEVRGTGGTFTHAPLRSVPAEARDGVRAASEVYPSEWIEHSNDDVVPFHVEATTDRAHYSHGNELLVPDSTARRGLDYSVSTAVHEFGHRMEKVVPGLREMEFSFYSRRVGDDALRPLGPGYDDDEVYRPDKFGETYSGKSYEGYYGNPVRASWELFTMGVQTFLSPREERSSWTQREVIFDDDDYRRFVLGALFGL